MEAAPENQGLSPLQTAGVSNPSSPSVSDSAVVSRSVSIQDDLSGKQRSEQELPLGIETSESAPLHTSNEERIGSTFSANQPFLYAATAFKANTFASAANIRQKVQWENAKGIN